MGTRLADVSIESAHTARELCTELADVGVDLAEMAGKVGTLVDRLDNLAVKNVISAGGMGIDSAAASPELTADQAIADRRAADQPAPKPPATPGPPWQVRGTLDDGGRAGRGPAARGAGCGRGAVEWRGARAPLRVLGALGGGGGGRAGPELLRRGGAWAPRRGD